MSPETLRALAENCQRAGSGLSFNQPDMHFAAELLRQLARQAPFLNERNNDEQGGKQDLHDRIGH